jgi:hypothetical protein
MSLPGRSGGRAGCELAASGNLSLKYVSNNENLRRY